MADILYTIEYDDEDGFQRPKQQILKIGTSPDRVAFATTKETAAYLAKRKKKVALRITSKRDRIPFANGAMQNPYIVPLETDNLEFFEVVEKGKQGAFHLTCGEMDAKTHRFKAWDMPKLPPPPTPSIPFPE
jgi:hypothetical protein